jgi:hypothetical protein
MGPVANQPLKYRGPARIVASFRNGGRLLGLVMLAAGLIVGAAPAAHAYEPGLWHHGVISKTPWQKDGPMRIQLDRIDYLLMPQATITRYTRDNAGHINAQPMDYRYLLRGQRIRFKAQGFSIYALELEP